MWKDASGVHEKLRVPSLPQSWPSGDEAVVGVVHPNRCPDFLAFPVTEVANGLQRAVALLDQCFNVLRDVLKVFEPASLGFAVHGSIGLHDAKGYRVHFGARKRSESMTEESLRRARGLFVLSADESYFVSPDGRIVAPNRSPTNRRFWYGRRRCFAISGDRKGLVDAPWVAQGVAGRHLRRGVQAESRVLGDSESAAWILTFPSSP